MNMEQEKTVNQKESKRILSLDVLRGITIAGMILVNNPGNWSTVYTPLLHVDWHGLTPTDLIFPFFMFIMGISTFISLRKTNFSFTSDSLKKIIKRTFVIFLIGLGLSWVSISIAAFYRLGAEDISILERLGRSIIDFENIRILGVMQRLALSYGIAALIAISVKHKHIPILIATLLIGYFIILLVGNGFAQGDGNILAIVDQKILGLKHMYVSHGIDPEGILSTIPSVAHVLIGFLIGKVLFDQKENTQRMLVLFIWGSILTFIGFLFSYACPINKKIWSPSFVLISCGVGSTLLALLFWIIDEKGHKKWSVFFESFGANPLFIYVLSSLLATLIGQITIGSTSIKGILYSGLEVIGLPDKLTSLLFGVLFVAVCWIVGHQLYKRKIYIKI